MDLVALVLTAIWVMLPAYIPNNVAVLAGGGRPIDGGRTWNGRRVLGDGKTWRGAIAGIAAGIVLALALNAIQAPVRGTFGLDVPTFSVGILVAFPVGAILGDMAASFVKRRTGRQRGQPWPGMDQLDFLLMSLLAGLVLDRTWMFDTFTPALLAVVVLLTPVLHLTTNWIAYVFGLKDEPW